MMQRTDLNQYKVQSVNVEERYEFPENAEGKPKGIKTKGQNIIYIKAQQRNQTN